jgi:hypothetical protein
MRRYRGLSSVLAVVGVLASAACTNVTSRDDGRDRPNDTAGDDSDLADTDTADTDSGDAGPRPIRFIALGDGGEGNAAQYAVGAVMAEVCAARGCAFAIYLGDNFYDTGVSSVDDEQFQTKFELPYAAVDLPFWVALGNHDYGGEGLGIEFWKADPQIEYSDRSDKWNMPDRYYDFWSSDAHFVALDTNAILYGLSDGQEDFVDGALEQPASWRIAFGHHPYISNGRHGNAGNYEGIPPQVPFAEIPRGDYVRDFVEDHLCGHVDVVFAGHDHNRQWLEPRCGTMFVVSGAAAKTTDDENRGNPVRFEDFDSPGLTWVELQGDVMTLAFYDQEGNLQYEGTAQRPW